MERQGDIAIYRQTHKVRQVERYVAVKICVRPAHTWLNGTTTPEHEAYPKAQSWGTLGWTRFTLADAQALAQQLRDRAAASAS